MQYLVFSGFFNDPDACWGAEQICALSNDLSVAKIEAVKVVARMHDWAHIYDVKAQEIVFETDRDAISFSKILESVKEQE